MLSTNDLADLINRARIETWKVLDLSGCDLAELPETIGQLVHLKSLELSNNHLTELPVTVGQLEGLKVLSLRDNHLTELPTSIRRLNGLRVLNLSGNELTALPDLPESMGFRSGLETLLLAGNLISELPASVARLAHLKVLSLNRNYLRQIPDSIGGIRGLKILHVSDNKIRAVPESIGRLQNLRSLTLARNQLAELPLSIWDLRTLYHLDLRGNIGVQTDARYVRRHSNVLVEALDDDDFKVVIAAAESLRAQKYQRTADLLVKAMSKEDRWKFIAYDLKVRALSILRQFKTPVVEEFLIGELGKGASRSMMVPLLASFGGPRATKCLMALLEETVSSFTTLERDVDWRLDAVRALGEAREPRAAGLLSVLMMSSEKAFREADHSWGDAAWFEGGLRTLEEIAVALGKIGDRQSLARLQFYADERVGFKQTKAVKQAAKDAIEAIRQG